jgi:hypothetical protein
MKKQIIALALASTTASSFAVTLENIIEPFALPISASYTAGDWSDVQNIKGVKWNQGGLRITPVGVSKSGRATLSKLGTASIFFKGAQTMVLEGSVTVSEATGKVFEKEQFDTVLKEQLSPTTRARKLRGACPDEGAIGGDSLYEVTLAGKKPVYVLVMTDAGGSSPNSRTSSFEFSLQNERRWDCSW